MLSVGVLSMKVKIKTYQGIHRVVIQYRNLLTPEPDLPRIFESQLRDRLRKSGTRLESLQDVNADIILALPQF